VPAAIDITGQRYGRLVAVAVDTIGLRKKRSWHCLCDCGNEAVVLLFNLKSGRTKSCGCLRVESNKVNAEKNTTHGMFGTSEYEAWSSMKHRCANSNNESYHNYGGRGIQVCARWAESFENFYADMGDKPSDRHSLDRRENDGNYEPGNCRWATWEEQAENRRSTIMIAHNGLSKSRASLCREFGLKYHVLVQRLGSGWELDLALNTPVRGDARGRS
jgi:hypothetical protein